MPKIISTPTQEKNAKGSNKQYGFGYFEAQHTRRSQEDALAWQTLAPKNLSAAGDTDQLSAKEIGHRLWTSYRLLDRNFGNAGTTASTTVYDGKGNLITATLADAVAFAAVYDKQGTVAGVIRLNSKTHKPEDLSEEQRIRNAGGCVTCFKGVHRVNGALAVSRAIGDFKYKKAGVCSEATIDITSVDDIAKQLKIERNNIRKIQVISTCDRFTDGAGLDDQTKEGHEGYLLNKLNTIASLGTQSEEELAELLVEAAKTDGSRDNISVAVQSITDDTPAFLLGLYDGHSGSEASVFVAKNMGNTFIRQCTLSPAAYDQQEFSVSKNQEVYKRDNPTSFDIKEEKEKRFKSIIEKLKKLTQDYQKNLDPNKKVTEEIKPILEELNTILNNNKYTADVKIKQFYKYLDQSSAKNIEVIKQDKSISAKNYLAGIAIILATLATGILPGLIISSIVYAATGRSPLDLFNTKGQQFAKELDLVKRQPHYLGGTFFDSSRNQSGHKVDDNELSPATNTLP